MRYLLLALNLFCFTGCGSISNLRAVHLRNRDAAKRAKLSDAMQKEAQQRLNKYYGTEALGEVVEVDEESGFVLLRNLRTPGLSINKGYETRGARAGIRVQTGSISKGNFVAADILQGVPQPGDVFFLAKEQQTKQDPFTKYGGRALDQQPVKDSDLPALPPVESKPLEPLPQMPPGPELINENEPASNAP